jgi:hypothetical protein
VVPPQGSGLAQVLEGVRGEGAPRRRSLGSEHVRGGRVLTWGNGARRAGAWCEGGQD